MLGIRPVPDHMPIAGEPGFEIGWQLDPQYFGQGYASEAAGGWLDHGFWELGIAEVIAYTATSNRASVNVMKRIGMMRDGARDFDHPRVAEGHPLRPQIVYSVLRAPPRDPVT